MRNNYDKSAMDLSKYLERKYERTFNHSWDDLTEEVKKRHPDVFEELNMFEKKERNMTMPREPSKRQPPRNPWGLIVLLSLAIPLLVIMALHYL